jgi:hypothetical protein
VTDLHKIAFDYRNAVLPDDAHEAWIDLEEYVKQLVNEEREACAQVCEEVEEPLYSGYENPNTFDDGKSFCAKAIRARGQA